MRSLCFWAAGALAALIPSAEVRGQPEVKGREVYASSTDGLQAPAMSPDNRWLVFTRWIPGGGNQILVRPVAGGPVRELLTDAGEYYQLRFSPQSDRLVFTSTAPRRSAEDRNFYLVSAPFDTRTGTLSAPPRQVTLDPIRREPRSAPSISPDGKLIAYLLCCGDSELRVVPIVGGNSKTLVTATGRGNTIPGWLGWTSDSRFVRYHVRERDVSTLLRVSVNGGASTMESQFAYGFGMRTADGKYFLGLGQQTTNGPFLVSVATMDGRLLGSVKVPLIRDITFSGDGTQLLGRLDKTTATLTVVPTTGGALRKLGSGVSSEWPEGWSADSKTLYYSAREQDKKVWRFVSTDGTPVGKAEEPVARSIQGILGGQLITKAESLFVRPGKQTRRRTDLMSRDLKSGKEKLLLRDIVRDGRCCGIIPPGGMYYGIVGDEVYVSQVRDNRLLVRGFRADGSSRLIVDVPRELFETTPFAIYGTRAAYVETGKDSTRLKVSPGPGKTAVTIAAYPRSTRISEFAWSHDGRQLSMYSAQAPRQLQVFRFSESGSLQGAPLQLTLPFEYFYETFWLPDGSGMTMIAQPTGSPTAEIAVVKFAEPNAPIYPAKSEPVNKWGHALSPDGRFISYPSEKPNGSAIYAISLSDLLRAVGVGK